MIYLDNASTSYVYPECIEVINTILKDSWGNPSNLYQFGKDSKELIDYSKEVIARTINCSPNEIFFTSGSSEGNAWGMKQRKYTIASPYEHHSIIENPNTIIVSDEDFLKEQNLVKRKLFKNSVYAHMLVSNETGEIFDVYSLFKKARKLNMFILCDMTQAFGNMNIDMSKIDCDMAVFSGHKFHAPKGIGFVYINKNRINNIVPLVYGTQQNAMRGGTENIAYIYSLAKAAKMTNDEIDLKSFKSRQFNMAILAELERSGIDFIVNRAYNSIESTLNISLKNVESEVIQMILSEKEIYIGVGSGCNNSLFEPSHTLQAMNIPKEYINGPIRFSYSVETKMEEVEEAVKELINTYKELSNA